MKPSLDNVNTLGQDFLDAWDNTMKPAVQGVEAVADDALKKWDASIQPTVQNVVNLGSSALNTWDNSMKPTLDRALTLLEEAWGYLETLIPILIAFGTIWCAMCCISATMCLLSAKRHRASSSTRRSLPEDSNIPGGPSSLFHDMPPAAAGKRHL